MTGKKLWKCDRIKQFQVFKVFFLSNYCSANWSFKIKTKVPKVGNKIKIDKNKHKILIVRIRWKEKNIRSRISSWSQMKWFFEKNVFFLFLKKYNYLERKKPTKELEVSAQAQIFCRASSAHLFKNDKQLNHPNGWPPVRVAYKHINIYYFPFRDFFVIMTKSESSKSKGRRWRRCLN